MKKHSPKNAVGRYSKTKVKTVLEYWESVVAEAKEAGTMSGFFDNGGRKKRYERFACDECGHTFVTHRCHAVRHVKAKHNGDETKIIKEPVHRLWCGRFISDKEIADFFHEPDICDTKGADYSVSWKVIKPLMREIEKRDDTYVPLYYALIAKCEEAKTSFLDKIRNDFALIHQPPRSDETQLTKIHEVAAKWLGERCEKDILRTPANLRAAVQTFEGNEVNEVKQRTVYAMQHQPVRIMSDLLKLLTYAYRQRRFGLASGFDVTNDFSVAKFLKDLLLEVTTGASEHPFIVEFCLMWPFRVKGENITMISCDTFSSLFSRMISVCKAGVCSVIVSFRTDSAYQKYGTPLVDKIRQNSVLHILCPMVRQLREMASRIPKKRKCTLDLEKGDIVVDQFRFPYNTWSQILPLTVEKMNICLEKMVSGLSGSWFLIWIRKSMWWWTKRQVTFRF